MPSFSKYHLQSCSSHSTFSAYFLSIAWSLYHSRLHPHVPPVLQQSILQIVHLTHHSSRTPLLQALWTLLNLPMCTPRSTLSVYCTRLSPQSVWPPRIPSDLLSLGLLLVNAFALWHFPSLNMYSYRTTCFGFQFLLCPLIALFEPSLCPCCACWTKLPPPLLLTACRTPQDLLVPL